MPATAATNASNNSMLPQQVGQAINQTFGNYTVFKKNFTEAALSVFGSGVTPESLSCCLRPEALLRVSSLRAVSVSHASQHYSLQIPISFY